MSPAESTRIPVDARARRNTAAANGLRKMFPLHNTRILVGFGRAPSNASAARRREACSIRSGTRRSRLKSSATTDPPVGTAASHPPRHDTRPAHEPVAPQHFVAMIWEPLPVDMRRGSIGRRMPLDPDLTNSRRAWANLMPLPLDGNHAGGP